MSDATSGTAAGRDAVIDFLTTVPLLEGMPEPELAELARVLYPRDVPEGQVLWREGEEAAGMLLVVDGRVSVSLRLPGQPAVDVWSAGSGELLGDVPLVDGGRHSGTARAVEPARLLSLSRADFASLLARGHPLAFSLNRRLAHFLCARLRLRLAALAEAPGGDAAGTSVPEVTPAAGDLESCAPPNSAYVRRLAAFRSFDSLALFGFLTSGSYVRGPAGRTVVAEGEASAACYLTMNGAVEKVIVRAGRRIRVGLAGPGQAFAYESLIDGGPAALTAVARERVLLLRLSRQAFDRLFQGDTARSHAFLELINRELVAALREALRGQARLAASRPAWAADPPARR